MTDGYTKVSTDGYTKVSTEDSTVGSTYPSTIMLEPTTDVYGRSTIVFDDASTQYTYNASATEATTTVLVSTEYLEDVTW